MRYYPNPKLLQTLVTMPTAIWGIERLNNGYGGATVRVRRSSDNLELDCYTVADISAHCSGTNGFVTTLYDQSGNGRNVTNATTSQQPKIYDSSTGLVKFGANVAMQFDGVNHVLSRSDNSGLPTGSPAITSVSLFGSWTNLNSKAWSIGPNTVSTPDCWYQGRSASTTMFLAIRNGPARTFNVTDPSSAPCYTVGQKDLNADISTAVMRQNGSNCSQSSVTAGAQAMTAGTTRIGAMVDGTQLAAMTMALNGHWNALLGTAEISQLESYLERMRVQ